MPHTDSAKKRQRQNVVRRARNRAVKSDIRSQIKRVLMAVKDGNKEQATAELKVVYQKLDKSAARRYLHPNTAHRYKSRLAARVNKMGPAKSA